MKKSKSHARHVFTFLEKNYNIELQFSNEDEKPQKGKKLERKGSDLKPGGKKDFDTESLGRKST